ncbi:MAG: HesB/IscA family protein [Methylocystis sp.]|jgi:iron-sulfur cluster assembly protein
MIIGSSSAVLTVSAAATERLREILASANKGEGLRVGVEKGGCAGMSYKMTLAEPQQGDEIIETEGGRVIIDAKAILYLIGSKLDVKTTQFSSTFVFENPNQTSACGCGESIELKPAGTTHS